MSLTTPHVRSPSGTSGATAAPVAGRAAVMSGERGWKVRTARIIVTAAALTLGLAAFGGTADAHPRGFPFDLTCDSVAYDVFAVPGSQYWSSVQDAASNRIFHPVAFGDVHVTVLHPDGQVIDEFTEPDGATRGKSSSGSKDIIECTYGYTNVDRDGFSYVVEGDVSGYWTPRQR
jgi:hypothetical protein